MARERSVMRQHEVDKLHSLLTVIGNCCSYRSCKVKMNEPYEGLGAATGIGVGHRRRSRNIVQKLRLKYHFLH